MWCPYCRQQVLHNADVSKHTCSKCGCIFMVLQEGSAPHWLEKTFNEPTVFEEDGA